MAMTLALLAQAALHQLRRRLASPFSDWDAAHLAKSLLEGLEGDVRVQDDTILVTYYNAPHVEQLRQHYERLPQRLATNRSIPTSPGCMASSSTSAFGDPPQKSN